jgi:DNA-binding response OmpR family regulator
MVTASCPALVVFDDDEFRRNLIKTLDEQHFSVSFTPDGAEAINLLDSRTFQIVIVGVSLATKKGLKTLDYLKDKKGDRSVIIVGEASPEMRTYAPWADETLLKPVDPAWIVTRARSYCGH